MDDPDPYSTLYLLAEITNLNPNVLAEAEGASTGNIIVRLLILLALILMNAFFSMSEIAIISLNDNKIDKLAAEGHKKSQQIKALTSNSSVFLSTIQIGVTLAGFLTSAAAAQSFTPSVVRFFQPIIGSVIPEALLNGIATFVITLIISYFSLVLGELVPKKVAMQKSEKISYFVVGILLFISKIFKPFIKILVLSTNAFVRLLGIDPHSDTESFTEEEILMMVDVGEEKGFIENTQREMINNVFEFDDIDAGDIMTHRVDITAVEVDEPLKAVLDAAIEDGYSRIPVFDDDPDNIIGIVYIKDLLRYVGAELPKDQTLRSIMREAYFVPETKRCGELFTEMSEKHVQMAIVVDEYGGTAGLVTLEDLVEAIVGNIQDEYDDESEEISRINDTTFTVDGVTDIDELDELIGMHLPDGDYDTLGGFIISQLGYLPTNENKEVVDYKNVRFTVLNVEDKRIGKITVEILPSEENEDKPKLKQLEGTEKDQ